MSYQQAEIIKKANVYHDGKVSSRTIVTSGGENKTLGIMLSGSYQFNTDAAEIMEILAGECCVRLDGSDAWISYQAGQSFHVPGKSFFDIEVIELLDYICHFE